ncbi:MAG TPA: hypothetical protein VND43_08810 [Burkholderiales bacterium]|nr:hypothetical protein [Burkholderiales bacterium]
MKTVMKSISALILGTFLLGSIPSYAADAAPGQTASSPAPGSGMNGTTSVPHEKKATKKAHKKVTRKAHKKVTKKAYKKHEKKIEKKGSKVSPATN